MGQTVVTCEKNHGLFIRNMAHPRPQSESPDSEMRRDELVHFEATRDQSVMPKTMSLFGKKGSDDSELARQTAIKQSLNRELSTGIKKLQKNHISSDSAIRSGDTANRICNVLEAIFLHELKDSYASKLSSWSSFLAPAGADDDINVSVQSVSFWPFVVKFTHKDVVQQVKSLSLINNEVGYCRAWIRMGLNDSLMDSYVDAMLSDAKTIRTFYKRTSFLRDAEQPHIMKNYLQGLGNFAFQLSYNSSVLNIWGAAPMIAAGSWAPPRDSPVSEPSTPRGVTPGGVSGLVHQYSDPTSTYSAPKTRQENSPLADPETNVTQAIEGSFHESEISSNLLHSPSDDDAPLVVPVAMVTDSKKQISPRKEKHSKHEQSTQRISQTHHQEVVTHGDTTVRQKEHTLQEQAVHVQKQAAEFGTGFGESEKKKAKPADTVVDSHISNVGQEDDSIECHLDTADSSYDPNVPSEPIPPNPFEETLATDPFDEPAAQSPFDEPAAQNPFDEQVDTSATDGFGIRNEAPSDSTGTAGDDLEQHDVDRNKEPELEQQIIPFAIGRDGAPPVPSLVTAGDKPHEDQKRLEENYSQDDFSDSFQGNSLGARSGWSSSFEQQANTPTGPEASLPGASPTSRTALASYKSLLQDYASQGTTGSIPTTTLDDLLGQMPSRERPEPVPTAPKEGRVASSSSGISDTDISLDYEVIPFSSSPTSKYADTRTQSLLNIVTVIGREKGLDSQNYQCKGCSRPVGIIYGKANVCCYDGCYYCYECHTDDEAIIPAKILYSWDFRKHKVSKHTKVFLQQIEAMPLIDVGQCNPSLYRAIPELADIMILRSQLKYLKAYLFTCQQSVAEELRKKVWPREYMLDHMHLYSTQDFLQIQAGNLAQFLKRVIVFAAKHVQQCALCSQKGFICEICNNDKVIYPFDVELTVRCEKCTTVFHKACKTEAKPCPKCERRRLRKGHPQFHGSQEEVDFATPFT